MEQRPLSVIAIQKFINTGGTRHIMTRNRVKAVFKKMKDITMK